MLLSLGLLCNYMNYEIKGNLMREKVTFLYYYLIFATLPVCYSLDSELVSLFSSLNKINSALRLSSIKEKSQKIDQSKKIGVAFADSFVVENLKKQIINFLNEEARSQNSDISFNVISSDVLKDLESVVSGINKDIIMYIFSAATDRWEEELLYQKDIKGTLETFKKVFLIPARYAYRGSAILPYQSSQVEEYSDWYLFRWLYFGDPVSIDNVDDDGKQINKRTVQEIVGKIKVLLTA